MDQRVAAFVHYYAREGQVHHVQTVCNEVLKRRASPALQLWRAYGLLTGGAAAEALRELADLQLDPVAGAAATAAALHAHEGSKHPDQAAVAALRAQFEADEQAVEEEAALQLAALLSHTHSFERARGLLERCLRDAGGAAAAAAAARVRALLGWVVLSQQLAEPVADRDGSEIAAAGSMFEAVLATDGGDLEAILGKARVLEIQGQMQAAADLAGELAVRYPWFVPGLIERCRLLLAAGDWEGASSAAAQLMAADGSNVLGLAVTALHSLVREGDARSAAQQVADVAAAAAKEEPRNARMAYSLARPFARLVAPDPAMLEVTLSMAQRAAQLAPHEADYVAEVGHQQLLLEQLPAAAFHFEAALHLDSLCVPAAVGLVEVLVAQGKLVEAEAQLQMLPELLASVCPARHRGSTHADDEAAPTVALPSKPLGAERSLALSSQASTMQLDGSNQQQQDPAPQLLYLQGLLAWARGERAAAAAALERSVQLQLAEAEELPPGLEQVAAAEPARALGVVRWLLGAQGADPRQAGDAPAPALGRSIRILETLGRFTGQLPEAQLLYARALYLNGSFDAASRKVADVLRCSPREPAPHLLAVSIFVRQGRAAEAMQALDAAVSVNFGIRNSPLYHIVHAQVLVANGRLEDARKVLDTAMAAPGIRAPLSAEQRERLSKKGLEPSTHERAGVYLLLAEVHQKLWAQKQQRQQQDAAAAASPGLQLSGAPQSGRQQATAAAGRGGSATAESPEARKLLAEAVKEFTGTGEEVRVVLAECEMAIARGDVEGVLQRLQSVPAASPHYARAWTALAGVHLRHRRDKAAYVKCYLDLVDKSPDFDNYCLLGDAFLAIQEPMKAVRAFESALELSPKDAQLALKCAQALLTAHDYARAVDYYNRAVRNDPSKVSSQHELASLLIRLRQLPAAQAVLARCIDSVKSQDAHGARGGTEALALEADTLALMAKLHSAGHEPAEFESYQRRAIGAQRLLCERLQVEAGGGGGGAAADAARGRLVALWEALAEHYARSRQLEKAQEAHLEVLSACADHAPSLLALARIALAQGDVDKCQAQCVALLRAHPDNEDAATMLAEIMFHQESLDSALFHFGQLLEHRPRHYEALAQLIALLRRAGKLEDAAKHLAAAEDAAGAARVAGGREGGLYYCKGLQQRYLNNPRDALTQLNLVCKDPAWAPRALAQMVEIYLAPANEAAWADASEGGPGALSAAGSAPGGRLSGGGAAAAVERDEEGRCAVEAARALLQQIKPEDVEPARYQVLLAYTRMASKQKGEAEAAVGALLDLAAADPNNVPVLLALAHGFMLLKQVPKARNQLKRVSKLPYSPADADEFERAWLALADIHVQGGKFDLAQELCARCLKHNKSCARAWELTGAIAEREQAYADAATNYDAAWKLTGRTDPAVGYKLAFNHLKANRLVDAITVAQGVLKADPGYPKIRKDVLEKARAGLRP